MFVILIESRTFLWVSGFFLIHALSASAASLGPQQIFWTKSGLECVSFLHAQTQAKNQLLIAALWMLKCVKCLYLHLHCINYTHCCTKMIYATFHMTKKAPSMRVFTLWLCALEPIPISINNIFIEFVSALSDIDIFMHAFWLCIGLTVMQSEVFGRSCTRAHGFAVLALHGKGYTKEVSI